MLPRAALLLCLTSLLPPFALAGDAVPLLSGYVTAVDSSGGFDVEGRHIHLAPNAEFQTRQNNRDTTTKAPSVFYLGQPLDIYGRLDPSKTGIDATRIVIQPPEPAAVDGTAIIDLIPPPLHSSPGLQLVRADGYLLRISPHTALTLAPPLAPGSPLTTNQWIQYRGTQQPDGIVDVAEATVWPNVVEKREDHLRTRTEYDPAAVSPSSHQGSLSKAFLGPNVRKMPPHADSAMLERVQRIGNALIPAFQRNLPDSDPTKIHFRFEVIDSLQWRDAVNLPNGIVVIPYQVVDRLQSDSQLATVLADNIAEALEKDQLRNIPAAHRMTAAQLGGDVAGAFVPGLGVVAWAANRQVGKHIQSMRLQQSGRVSLCLLHDAGFDLAEAPTAWWLLNPKKPQPIEKTPLPERAANLYLSLGTTWRQTLASGSPTPARPPQP